MGQEVGQLGETRLFLMGALLLADELADVKMRLSHALADQAQSQSAGGRIEARAAAAIENAANRIEALATRAAG